MRHPQLNRQGALTHLLSIDGLASRILNQILERAEGILSTTATASATAGDDLLRLDHRVFTLFSDNQRPVEASFRLAAQRLSAVCVDLAPEAVGLEVSVRWEEQIGALKMSAGDLLVVQCSQSGAPERIAQHLAPQVHVINAGDGAHSQPIQALSQMLTIRQAKKELANLVVTLVADLKHSGLARSHIHALTTLCVAEVRVVAPLSLIPDGLEQMGVRVFTEASEGIRDADVVIVLEPRYEQMPLSLRLSAQDYFDHEALTQEKMVLAKPDCLVLHPERSEHAQTDIALWMAVMTLVASASA